MGCIKGAPEKDFLRLRYRGISAFCNKHGTVMTLKGQDGRHLYSERTDEQPTADRVKAVIDQIKDGLGRW